MRHGHNDEEQQEKSEVTQRLTRESHGSQIVCRRRVSYPGYKNTIKAQNINPGQTNNANKNNETIATMLMLRA
jgi:hypothetical protein